MATRLEDQRSLGELVSAATRDLGQLVRQEIELAKTETKQELRSASRLGAVFGAAGVLALVAVFLFAWAIAWALSEFMPTGLAFLLVGLGVAAAAAYAASLGRQKLKEFNAVPEETVETIKEDVQWLKARKT